MTQPNRPPEPQGEDWQTWGRRLMAYLSQTRIALAQKTGSENAADDGSFMWDRSGPYPVVSQNSAFNEVVVKQAAPSSSVGAAGNTSGMISWDTNYIYVCTAAYDGSANIWKRVALTGGAW